MPFDKKALIWREMYGIENCLSIKMIYDQYNFTNTHQIRNRERNRLIQNMIPKKYLLIKQFHGFLVDLEL